MNDQQSGMFVYNNTFFDSDFMVQQNLWDSNSQNLEQDIQPVLSASDGSTHDTWLGGVHPNAQLEVTSGFHLHPDKFSRVIAYLINERQSDGAIYEQLMKATGMSRTQIQAFIQYAVAMQLLIPRVLEPTPLSGQILNDDPFFDQAGTLWVLHYILASDPTLLIWNYMCNAVLPSISEISLSEAAEQFLPFAGHWSEGSIRKNVRKELNAFFANYTQEMFAPLRYLIDSDNKSYLSSRDVLLVPPCILLAAALIHRDRFHPGASGVEIPMLIHADNSPGRLMRQRETYIRQALDELHEAGLLTIESKANLDQVRFIRDFTWLDAVRGYYQTCEA